MHENLKRLTNELRKETCPQRVIDEVNRRIAAESPRPSRFAFAVSAAMVALVLLLGLVLWRLPKGPEAQQPTELAAQAPIDRAQVTRQAEGALGYIGQVLLTASSHSQRVILNDAVPQLRNSFEAAKTKLSNHIEL